MSSGKLTRYHMQRLFYPLWPLSPSVHNLGKENDRIKWRCVRVTSDCDFRLATSLGITGDATVCPPVQANNRETAFLGQKCGALVFAYVRVTDRLREVFYSKVYIFNSHGGLFFNPHPVIRGLWGPCRHENCHYLKMSLNLVPGFHVIITNVAWYHSWMFLYSVGELKNNYFEFNENCT